jgi:hypothetical protein
LCAVCLIAETHKTQELGLSENNPLVKELPHVFRDGGLPMTSMHLKQEERLDAAAQADETAAWATSPTSFNS